MDPKKSTTRVNFIMGLLVGLFIVLGTLLAWWYFRQEPPPESPPAASEGAMRASP